MEPQAIVVRVDPRGLTPGELAQLLRYLANSSAVAGIIVPEISR